MTPREADEPVARDPDQPTTVMEDDEPTLSRWRRIAARLRAERAARQQKGKASPPGGEGA
jgi:hypothetical protein